METKYVAESKELGFISSMNIDEQDWADGSFSTTITDYNFTRELTEAFLFSYSSGVIRELKEEGFIVYRAVLKIELDEYKHSY